MQPYHQRTNRKYALFLELCNVYRRFVERSSHQAGPLNEQLQNNMPGKFTLSDDKKLESFRHFINAVLSQPALALLQVGLPYSVDTEASAYGFG